MSVYQNKGYWYCDFQFELPSGERKRIREPLRDEKQRPCKSKTAAEKSELRLRDGLVSGALAIDSGGRVAAAVHAPAKQLTLDGFRERYFAEHVAKLKPSSRSAHDTIWRLWLLPLLKGVKLAEVSEAHFAKVARAMREDGRSAKTINNGLSALRTVLTVANEWSLRGPPPRVRWEKVGEAEIEWFDAKDVAKLVAVGDPMVTFALKTGLRLGELRALTWGDVELGKAPRITVSKSVWDGPDKKHHGHTKSNRIRVVPLPPSAVDALKAIGKGADDALVFVDARGHQLTKNGCKWPLWRVCEAAGVERCGWHKLRHSYVSALVAKNVPLPQVQKLAGHARIEMTMRYTHVSENHLRDAVAALE